MSERLTELARQLDEEAAKPWTPEKLAKTAKLFVEWDILYAAERDAVRNPVLVRTLDAVEALAVHVERLADYVDELRRNIAELR